MRYASSLVVSLCVAACGPLGLEKKDSKERTASPDFDLGFPRAELAAEGGTMKQTSRDDVATFLDHNEKFFQQADEDAASEETTSSDADTCFYSDDLRAAKVDAAGSTMKVSLDVDKTACAQEYFAQSSVVKMTASRFRYLVSFYMSCAGADFKEFDGKTYLEVTKAFESGAVPACAEDVAAVSFNSKSELVYDVEVNGKATSYAVTIWSAQLAEDGAACKNGPAGQDCVSIEKSLTTSKAWDAAEPTTALEYSRIARKGNKFADGKTYLQGPNVQVTKNDWSGSVTLFDGDRAPEWSMSNGTEVATGSITVEAGN